jgi:hypothetical protein
LTSDSNSYAHASVIHGSNPGSSSFEQLVKDRVIVRIKNSFFIGIKF